MEFQAVALSESPTSARRAAAIMLSGGMRWTSYTLSVHRCAEGRLGSRAIALRAASRARGIAPRERWSRHSRAFSAARTMLLSRWPIASPRIAGVLPAIVKIIPNPELPSLMRMRAVYDALLRLSRPLVYALTLSDRASCDAC